MWLHVVLITYGIFIVLLCWRTLLLTIRIEQLESPTKPGGSHDRDS